MGDIGVKSDDSDVRSRPAVGDFMRYVIIGVEQNVVLLRGGEGMGIFPGVLACESVRRDVKGGGHCELG